MYDQPLCSLFSPGDAAGFTGKCDLLPTSCTHNSTWCDGGNNPDSEAVEELMALQLTKASCTQSLYGLLTIVDVVGILCCSCVQLVWMLLLYCVVVVSMLVWAHRGVGTPGMRHV